MGAFVHSLLARPFYQYNGTVVAEYDLHLLPFNRVKGQEWPQLPGLLACTPPKRCARGRENDYAIIYLTLAGSTPFTSGEYNQVISQLAERFYQQPGSLTAAVRTTVDILNQFLVERNMKASGTGQYQAGRLIFAVLRGSQFVIAQSGPTHAFHLKAGEVVQIHDDQMSGRGLGFGQMTPLHFTQVALHPGDQLILCSQLPSGWQPALQADKGPIGMEATRRKLLAASEDDLNAVLIQAVAGKGQLNVLQAMKPAVEMPVAQPVSRPGSGPIPPQSRPASRFARLVAGREEPAGEAAAQSGMPPGSPPSAAVQPSQTMPPAQRPPGGGRFVAPRSTSDLPEIERQARAPRLRLQRRGIFRGLARSLHGLRTFGERLSEGLGRFLPRLLPGAEGNGQALRVFMTIVAIAVPLVVVVLAGTVYVRIGKQSQYEQNYQLAVQSAVGAIGQSDMAVVRHAWESCLFYLDRADGYQLTTESQSLRREAQAALDGLDGIIRLDFRQVVGALSDTVQVSRMVATEDALFLLNSTRGNVMHALMTNQGFEVDPYFKCEPGTYNGIQVGTLIDLAALPAINLRNADVLAMDANGTLLYCTVGSEPAAVPLVPPELGWRGVSGFTLDIDGRNLYLLDPPGNAVWVYTGNLGEFTDLPMIFFGEYVPHDMGSVIDLAANGDDLYLLFQDGHVTVCTLSRLDVARTRCSDPATFIDERPGHQPGLVITDAIFSQMTFASPPDPSLYLLEPLTQAVYRFNPHTDSLTLQAQFRATVDQVRTQFRSPAVAMAISPNRAIFLCVGNKIYYAGAVP
ncbi:MAG: hypothetical protein JXB85_02030 [Anaerolineales bacterium]|nr:hypothetical protein [Anaerolineales bacterium]